MLASHYSLGNHVKSDSVTLIPPVTGGSIWLGLKVSV